MAGRISQLRRELQEAWQEFQGENVEEKGDDDFFCLRFVGKALVVGLCPAFALNSGES